MSYKPLDEHLHSAEFSKLTGVSVKTLQGWNRTGAPEKFCLAPGMTIEEWRAVTGGGLNFKLHSFTGWVDRVIKENFVLQVIAHPDRLARFGYTDARAKPAHVPHHLVRGRADTPMPL